MSKPQTLERVVLEISHDRVQLYHAVADGSTSRKRDALAPGKFVHVSAFHKHVRGLLGISLRNASNIPHFRVEEQVLVVVALIHKKTVNAQLFKRDYIILTALIV